MTTETQEIVGLWVYEDLEWVIKVPQEYLACAILRHRTEGDAKFLNGDVSG